MHTVLDNVERPYTTVPANYEFLLAMGITGFRDPGASIPLKTLLHWQREIAESLTRVVLRHRRRGATGGADEFHESCAAATATIEQCRPVAERLGHNGTQMASAPCRAGLTGRSKATDRPQRGVFCIRPNSTLQVGRYEVMASDTAVSTTRTAYWGRASGDTLLWWSRSKHRSDTRIALAIRGQELIEVSDQNPSTFKRVDSVVLASRFHPRPAPTSTGTMAKLVGTWEYQHPAADPNIGRIRRQVIRRTIRTDSTLIETIISLADTGMDTSSIGTTLGRITVSGDTVWWRWGRQGKKGIGHKLVVQNDRLSFFGWGNQSPWAAFLEAVPRFCTGDPR